MAWKAKKGGRKRAFAKKWSNGYINAGMLVDSKRVKILQERKFKSLGHSVSYREHVKSMGHVKDGGLPSPYHDLPTTLIPTLEKYHGVPDDKVPPIIAVIRKRKEIKQERIMGVATVSEWLHYCVMPGKQYDLFCFFSGARAYFVERDMYRMRIRMSHEYTTEYARLLSNSVDPDKKIKWKETLPITSDPPA